MSTRQGEGVGEREKPRDTYIPSISIEMYLYEYLERGERDGQPGSLSISLFYSFLFFSIPFLFHSFSIPFPFLPSGCHRRRQRLRNRYFQSCTARSSEDSTIADRALEPQASGGYDAEAVRDFFHSADLEQGYAILRRNQPGGIAQLAEEMAVASEQEQAWQIPLQECAVYVPVGDVDW